MRRAILRLRRFNWRWTLALTRKPPGGEWLRGVKYLNYPPNPEGFRASWPPSDSHYAWLRTRQGAYAKALSSLDQALEALGTTDDSLVTAADRRDSTKLRPLPLTV